MCQDFRLVLLQTHILYHRVYIVVLLILLDHHRPVGSGRYCYYSSLQWMMMMSALLLSLDRAYCRIISRLQSIHPSQTMLNKCSVIVDAAAIGATVCDVAAALSYSS